MRLLVFILLILMVNSCRNKVETKSENEDPVKTLLSKTKNRKIPTNERRVTIDSAYELVKARNIDTLWLDVLHQKGIILLKEKEYDHLFATLKQLDSGATYLGNNRYLAQSNFIKAHYYKEISSQPDSSFKYYTRAISNYKSSNDSSEVGAMLVNMAYVQRDASDYFGSKESLTEALQYLSQESDQRWIGSAYSALASNYRKLKDFQGAVKSYDKAIAISNNSQSVLKYKNNLATLLIEQESYQKAISLLNELIKDPDFSSLPETGQIRFQDNLDYALWKQNKILNDAQNAFLTTLKKRKRIGDHIGLIASYTRLGELYLEVDEKKAISWFDKARQQSIKTNRPQGELDALKFMMATSASDNIIKDRYILLKDSLYDLGLKVKTQFAKIRYDDKLKTEEISKLKLATEKQQLALSVQRRQKIIYVLSGIILILVAAFLTRRKIRQLKIQNEEVIQKTKQHLSKRIHDELANDLYSVMIQLDNEGVYLKAVDQIENIYERTRDISRETEIAISGGNYKEELLEMLYGYLSESDTLITKGLDAIQWHQYETDLKGNLYRILQELITNFKKHSNGNVVHLSFDEKEHILAIHYSDNGTNKDSFNIVAGNGIKNTETRIQLLRGTISFDTESNNRFNVTIEIPV